MIDFSQIPEWWPLCPNTQCPMATSCLRHQAFLQAPQDVTSWTCLLPSAWNNSQSNATPCAYYQSVQTVRMARGFQNICSQLKKHDAPQEFRETLTEYFGNVGNYYRYRNGTNLLSPDQQQFIHDLLHRLGYDHLDFDDYVDQYDFHPVEK